MVGAIDKTMSLREAVSTFVHDGCSIAYGGIFSREPMAVTHEIIRQGKTDLTFITDTTADAANILIGAGCVKKVEMAYIWMGVVGKGINLQRAVQEGIPRKIEIEEYSNFAASMRFLAGALDVPFMPTRSLLGTDIPRHNPRIKILEDPYAGEKIALVPAARPDVAFIHVQRADRMGNGQIWGMLANDPLMARAAEKVVVTCEEIVPTSEIRRHPNMTAIPYYCVDAVVHVPFGAHPISVAGYYWVDVPFRRSFMARNHTQEQFMDWVREWILELPDWEAYLDKVGRDRLDRLVQMELDNYRIQD